MAQLTKLRTDALQPTPVTPASEGGRGLLNSRAVRGAGLSTGLNLIEEGVRDLDRDDLRGQAEQLDFNAEQEQIKGSVEALTALEAMNEIQASNLVAAFASGIQASGSAARVQEVVGRKAAFAISLSKANATIRAGALTREANRLRAEAAFKESTSFFKILAGIGLTVFAFSGGGAGAGSSSRAISEKAFLAG